MSEHEDSIKSFVPADSNSSLVLIDNGKVLNKNETEPILDLMVPTNNNDP